MVECESDGPGQAWGWGRPGPSHRRVVCFWGRPAGTKPTNVVCDRFQPRRGVLKPPRPAGVICRRELGAVTTNRQLPALDRSRSWRRLRKRRTRRVGDAATRVGFALLVGIEAARQRAGPAPAPGAPRVIDVGAGRQRETDQPGHQAATADQTSRKSHRGFKRLVGRSADRLKAGARKHNLPGSPQIPRTILETDELLPQTRVSGGQREPTPRGTGAPVRRALKI